MPMHDCACASLALSEIADSLTWSEKMSVHPYIASYCGKTLAENFSVALARIRRVNDKKGRQLFEKARVLSEESLTRVITAPETVSKTGMNAPLVPTTPEYLGSALEAEVVRMKMLNGEGAGVCLPEAGMWTALGDCFFAHSNAQCVGMKSLTPGMFENTVANQKVVIDFANWTATGLGKYEIAYYSESEATSITSKLISIFHRIDETCAAAGECIRAHVRLITIRKLSSAKSYSSSSHPMYIGRVVLRNPDRMTDGGLESALVHEAIHQFLSTIELDRPFVVVDGPEPKIPSPWTGRLLQLRTLIHAFYVWFGLAHYWYLARRSDSTTFDGASQLESASRGFRIQNPRELLVPYQAALRDGLLDELVRMRERVSDLLGL